MYLNDDLSKGQPARLFPSLKLSNKEQIATSILLASFKIVPELLFALVRDIGIKANQNRIPQTYTQVELAVQSDGPVRKPDGYIFLKNRAAWSALVEAKVGNNVLQMEQLCHYLQLAIDNKIDALITISNEFTPHPAESPITPPAKLTKKVKLYHFSWRYILSTVLLLKHGKQIRDKEKEFVLNELVRFLNDDAVGEKSFVQMPLAWNEIYQQMSIGGSVNRSDSKLIEVAYALVQEFSDIALILTDHLGVSCKMKMPRKYIHEKGQWQRDVAQSISNRMPLRTEYIIPDAAGPLIMRINISSSIMSVEMELEAPKDIKTTKGRLGWLAKQIRNRTNPDGFVRIIWNSRAQDTVTSLDDLQTKKLHPPSPSAQITHFVVFNQVNSTKIFKSRKQIISSLENMVICFYDEFGQHLKAWVAKPPVPVNLAENTIE